jgi:hypothetical protein
MNLTLRHKFIKLFKLFLSFSDEGEDKLLLQVFMSRGIRSGTYLDIGAFHPVRVSNTYLLYLWGWKGITIDINRKWLFKLLRPRDKFIYGYVDAENSYKFKNALWTSDVEQAYYGVQKGLRPKIKYDVPRIDPYQFKDYDLLDLDVDGLDLQILQKLLSVYKPPFILAEDKALKVQEGICDYLISEGYTRIANTTRNGLYEKKN